MKGIIHAYAIVLAGLSLITGCGYNQDLTIKQDQTPLASICGKVAPGSVYNGLVTAVEVDSDGNVINELGRSLTDENGLYDITLVEPYQGNVILLQVRAGLYTTMRCPSLNGCGESAFGEWIALPSDFIMNAVFAPTGEKAKAHITPLTHMAADRVLSSGLVTPSATAMANSEISQLAGVSVLTCDIGELDNLEDLVSQGGPCLRHTLFLAGMADYLASSQDGNYDLVLQDLGHSFQAGTLRSDLTRTLIHRVRNAMDDVLASRNEAGQFTGDFIMSHTSLESVITSLSGEDYNPEPSDGAGKTSVAQAKLLLNQARTFVMQILENQTEPLSSLRIESVSVDSFMDDQILRLVQLLGETLKQVLSTTDLTGIIDEHTRTIVDSHLVPVGEVSLVSCVTTQGMSWSLDGDLWSGLPIHIRDLSIRTSLNTEDFSGLDSFLDENVSLTIDGRIENDFMSLAFQNTDLSLTLQDQDIEALVFKGSVMIRLLDRTYSGQAELVWDARESALTTQNVTWTQMDDGDTSVLDEGAQFLSQAYASLDPVLDLDDISFDESDFSVKGSKTLSFSKLSETTRTTLESYVDACVDDLGEPITVAMTYPDQDRVLLDCQGTGADGSIVRHALWFDVFQSLKQDLTQDIDEDYGGLLTPTLLSFYSFTFGGEPFISLTYSLSLSDMDNLDLFIQGHLTATVTAVIPEMPALSATVSVSRTHEKGGSLSMTIGFAGQNYTLYFEAADLSENIKGTLILSNPDDVRFILHASRDNYRDATGIVFVGDEIVGRIEIANGIPLVRYVDGTFESLF